MNKTIQSPVFVLFGRENEYQSEDIWFCADGFGDHMLPSWTGPLPKRIRFYVTPSANGEWLWSGVFIQSRCERLILAPFSLSDWLDRHGLQGRRLELEMEIIEP